MTGHHLSKPEPFITRRVMNETAVITSTGSLRLTIRVLLPGKINYNLF